MKPSHLSVKWGSGTLVLPILLMAGLLLSANPLTSLAAPVDTGYRDFSYGTTGNAAPSGEKPESKLWWNDGVWWGSLYNDAAQAYHIYRLDLGTQAWVDTGTTLDTRNGTRRSE